MTDYVRYDFYPDDFQRYTKLKRLVIERSKPSTYQTFPKINKVYQDCFRDAKSLQQFEFTNSNLSEKFTIGWPKNVKFLKIDNNKFQQLDLQGCKEIQELSANGNNLINLPKFHYPLPPIKIMRLKGNPLDNMTILTIAPLCELTLIELEFPPGSHYAQKGSLVSYCDCQLLKKWAHEADISGPDKIECVELKSKINYEYRLFCINVQHFRRLSLFQKKSSCVQKTNLKKLRNCIQNAPYSSPKNTFQF